MIMPVAVKPVAACSAFEMPKSVSITLPWWSNMMFAGFTSRCTTPRWWACPSAHAASHSTRWMWSNARGCRFSRRSSSDVPEMYFIEVVESEGGLNYFVMKYISGTSLEDLLEKRQPLAFDHIQRVLWEAACALGHAHQRGVVHRDVKPANIMFDHHGRVMLTDFGISKALQAATGFTATGMIIGTPHYMAPEQAKGQTVDGRGGHAEGAEDAASRDRRHPDRSDVSAHDPAARGGASQARGPARSSGSAEIAGGIGRRAGGRARRARGRGLLPARALQAGAPVQREPSATERAHDARGRDGARGRAVCHAAAPRAATGARQGAAARCRGSAGLPHGRGRPVRHRVHRWRGDRRHAALQLRRQAGPPRDPRGARWLPDAERDRAGGCGQHRDQALHAHPGAAMTRTGGTRGTLWFVTLVLAATPAWAQAVRSPTLRQALQAYDQLNFPQAIVLANRSLREPLGGAERGRAYELLGSAYSAMDSALKAVDAFQPAILVDPDRQLDPTKISPKITSAFLLALGQVLVVRQLKVDSVRFVGGQAGAGVPIRFTITSPARVRVRALSGSTSLLIDSSAVTGTVSLRWPAVLRSGEPVPQGTWQIVVEATAGQNSFSASQGVRVSYGSVDTAGHVTSLPGYQELSETEIPPQSWRPLGLAFLYTGGALVGTLGLEGGAVGTASRREISVVGAAALLAGVVMTLRKPAPRPAEGNILYNRLLREQIARRNADIAKENVTRRQQVELTVVPLPKAAGGQ